MQDWLVDVVGACGGGFDGAQRRFCRNAFGQISQQFRDSAGHFPNILFPKALGELVQWRKVFDRNPLFPVLSDKLKVKSWAAQRVAGLKSAQVVWAAPDAHALPREFLRDGFVIKTNHGCSYNYFPWDHAVNDHEQVKRLFAQWLRIDYASLNSEWAYSQIERKVFVERMLSPRGETEDLKFWCHNGAVSLAYVAVNEKQPTERCGYFSVEGAPVFNPLYTLDRDHRPPNCFAAAKEIARTLSVGFDYVRVDFIVCAGEPYLAEITLYPASGYGGSTSVSARVLAAWLKEIERSDFMRTAQPPLREAYKRRLRPHFDRLRRGLAEEITR